MRGLRGTGGLVLTAVLLAGCGDDDGGTAATTRAGTSPPKQPISPAARQYAASNSASEVVYRGTLKITVAYYDYDCQLRDFDLHRQATRTYRMPVRVVRGTRAAAEGIRESSPFNLIISSDPGNEAGITIVSATVVSDARDGKPILFEYWKISARGTHLDGKLAQSWRQAGIAANVFPTDRLVVPCRPDLGLIPRTIQTMDEGARLTGTITGRRADLTVTGQTFDHERRFTARITAKR